MKSGVLYIKNTDNFLFKFKNLGEIPQNAVLVTADVVGLYPSIPHDEGLEVLRKQLNAFNNKAIPTEDLGKWLNLFSRTIILNLIHLLNIKFREQLLELNLLHRINASLWITLKQNFSKTNKFSHGFGLDILMMFFYLES